MNQSTAQFSRTDKAFWQRSINVRATVSNLFLELSLNPRLIRDKDVFAGMWAARLVIERGWWD
jgi:hypothetical protein